MLLSKVPSEDCGDKEKNAAILNGKWVPVRSRRRCTRLRFSRKVVNSLCRLAKPVSPSPEALHNRAANQGFLFAVLATPSFTEGCAIFFAGDVVFLLRLLAFTRFALGGAGTEGPVLASL